MYNRYVPAEGGGYVRQSIPDEPIYDVPIQEPCWDPPQSPPCQEDRKTVFTRLKSLLPQGLDTGDLLVLIVVLLLLLEKDENNEDLLPVLITAAAFLFLK